MDIALYIKIIIAMTGLFGAILMAVAATNNGKGFLRDQLGLWGAGFLVMAGIAGAIALFIS